MGHIAIQRNDLDKQQVFDIFQSGLSDRFDVRRSALPAIDFVVRKNALVGVGVKLQNKGGKARLRCGAMVPSMILRMLTLNGLISSILMWPILRGTLRDVEAFASGSTSLSRAGSLEATTSLPRRPIDGPLERESKGSNPLLVPTWIGLTVLLIPSVANSLFGYRGLFIDRFVLGQAVVAAIVAVVALRLGPAGVARRPAAIGLIAFAAGSLATSLFGFGAMAEIRYWFTPFGAAKFALALGSFLLLARVCRGGNTRRGVTPVSPGA